MEQEAVQAFDLQRMFLGDQGFGFLFEVVFRTAFMFLYTLLLVRVLGKRGMGQLAPFELVIIIALGSAVGDPTFYPDVPLVHAMIVVAVIVLLQRALVRATDRSEKVETFVESQPTLVVRDGVILVPALREEHFARDELFITLREDGIEHLGQVKRAYLEPSGRVSVWYRSLEEAPPGRTIMPQTDPDAPTPYRVGDRAALNGELVCFSCGARRTFRIGDLLPGCFACECEEGWMEPVPGYQEGTGDRSDRPRRKRYAFGDA